MCSWCYAFAPVLQQLRQQLPGSVQLKTLLGGLAADTDEPMPVSLQQHLQSTWQRIEQQVPGTDFNYNFWTRCKPRRATYPACRAVIAAHYFDQPGSHDYHNKMIARIQTAYYQQARNPSEQDTLIALATELGLDGKKFIRLLTSLETQDELQKQINLSRKMAVFSYPSLVLNAGRVYHPVEVNYHKAEPMLETINKVLERL
jgi:putative protein-disulfide isomerase